MTAASAKPERQPRSARAAGSAARARSESTLEILERLLSETVTIKLNRAATEDTKFEAIILHMIQKGMSDDPRALSTLAEYEELGRRRPANPTSPRFVDSPYTRAMAKKSGRTRRVMAKYDVGFGKPPESGRFRRGVSGNPKGRPKQKPSTYAERVVDLFDAPLAYHEGGKAKVATRRELAYRMLVDKAAAGGDKEIKQVLRMLCAAPCAIPIRARSDRCRKLAAGPSGSDCGPEGRRGRRPKDTQLR